jgi:hypothetical protein
MLPQIKINFNCVVFSNTEYNLLIKIKLQYIYNTLKFCSSQRTAIEGGGGVHCV